MTTSDYRPIGCDQHSEYELLAMHGAWVELDVEGEAQLLRLRVRDLITRNGAEYLITEDVAGRRQAWRLDHLRRVTPLSTLD